MGAAGDMLMSALSELLPDPESFIDELNALDIPGVHVERRTSVKCGITGTHIDVTVDGICEDEHIHEHHEHHEHHGHHHSHTGMSEIEELISGLSVKDSVKDNAISVYRLIAEAESHAHGCEISEIHFHEVGTMDAVADIVGVCMLIDKIKPDKIIASPVCTGFGYVNCAHGTLPVPAPATAYILKDVPIYGGELKGELCTPTGAALLKHFVDEYSSMPIMRVTETGYGMGTKDFHTANCIRVMLGETGGTDKICELCCNIDDMTGEEIGYAVDKLMSEGAKDVFLTPVNMKKNRPGTLITCICGTDEREKFLRLMFKHTSTIGVRSHIWDRYVLDRELVATDTKYGRIRTKISSGYGIEKAKYEYEDLRRAAEANDLSIDEVKSALKQD